MPEDYSTMIYKVFKMKLHDYFMYDRRFKLRKEIVYFVKIIFYTLVERGEIHHVITLRHRILFFLENLKPRLGHYRYNLKAYTFSVKKRKIIIRDYIIERIINLLFLLEDINLEGRIIKNSCELGRFIDSYSEGMLKMDEKRFYIQMLKRWNRLYRDISARYMLMNVKYGWIKRNGSDEVNLALNYYLYPPKVKFGKVKQFYSDHNYQSLKNIEKDLKKIYGHEDAEEMLKRDYKMGLKDLGCWIFYFSDRWSEERLLRANWGVIRCYLDYRDTSRK